MSGVRPPQDEPAPSQQVRAEAAAWIAQLHDEQRSSHLQGRVDAWLGESEEHRRAFDRITRAWERAGELRMRPAANSAGRRRSSGSRWVAAAGLAACVALAGIVVYYRHGDDVVTGVGQQQVRLLRDGTRVVLNTDTRIEVDYDAEVRRVRLIRGEAWFDVSKRPAWPFVVTVGGREIRALGTSFIVRHDDIQNFSVTLVEGRISVAAAHEAASPDVRILTPGQRLRVSDDRSPIVDRPELARVTAWEHGRVEFDDTPLKDAADEMNRYSTRHVTMADADVARLRVGGVVRAGDSEEFLRIATAACGRRADRRGGDIVLSKLAAPASTPPPP